MNITLLITLALFVLSFLLVRKSFKTALVMLLILSVFLHKELFSINTWDILPARVFMLAFTGYFSLAFAKNLYKTRSIKILAMFKDPFVLTLILLWAVRGASILFSLNLTASISLFAFFTTMVVLGIVLYKYLIDKPEEILSYLQKYIWIALALCMFGLGQFFLYEKYEIIIGALWNIPGNLPRVGSTFWDVNHFGAFLALLIPVLGVFILVEKQLRKRIFLVLTSIPLVVLLFLTNSRSAWILAAVSLLAFATLLFIRKFKYKGIVILLALCFILAFPFFREYSIKTSTFRATVKQYFHYRMDSFDSHFLLLTGAGQIFERYPVLGGGYGGFFEQFRKMPVAPTYFGRDPAALNTRVPPHTIWGEALSETGLLGFTALSAFLLFGLSVLVYIALTFKTKREALLTAAMASALIGLMVAGIFYSYNSEFFFILIFLYFIYGFALIKGKVKYVEVVSYFIQSRPLPLFAIALIAGVLIFANLGVNHLIPWDEAIYAKVSKNILVTGDYSTLQWVQGTNWFEKPPLYMWLASAFMSILGFESLAPRLPSAIFGFGTVILIYFFGKKLFGKAGGFISAFALVTTFQFLYYTRAAMLDVTTGFFITLALVLYYLARDKAKLYLWVVSGIACGLAVMTKDVIGLVPIPIILLFELFLAISDKEKKTKVPVKGYLMFFIASAAVFLPWHIHMLQLYGAEFFDSYIKYHVIDRATSSIEDKGQPFWWYLIVMKVSMRLWFIALLAAFPFTLYMTGLFAKIQIKIKSLPTIDKTAKNQAVFLTIWAVFILIFFSSATSKLVWYIMPIYPVAALIVGNLASYLLNRFSSIFIRLLLIYLLVFTNLLYLLVNKGLVYTSDLTGSESRLIALKDKTFSPTTVLYYDKVERPLILYYTDGPTVEIDMAQLRAKLKNKRPEEAYVFLTKESRYEKLSEEFPTLRLVAKDDAWALGNYPAATVQPINQKSSNN